MRIPKQALIVPFQMLDMIMPKKRNVISLQDLKGCRMTPIFFDTFFNLEKYLDHEQRDPFASQRDVDEDGNEVTSISKLILNLFAFMIAFIHFCRCQIGIVLLLKNMNYS